MITNKELYETELGLLEDAYARGGIDPEKYRLIRRRLQSQIDQEVSKSE